jgi:hypothetical protein
MSSVKVVLAIFTAVGLSVGCDKSTSGNPTTPTPNPVTLAAPAHAAPADDAQTDTLQPNLTVVNVTPPQAGSRTYDFEVSSTNDFSAIAATGQNIPEGANGSTTWTVARPLQSNTRYWWRARVRQGSDVGPWSNPTRVRSRVEGFSRPGELYDPLTNGVTVGSPRNVTFVRGQGVRLDSLDSRVTYGLSQTLSEGEFSLLATGLNNASEGDSTKLFSMQQGTSDLTTNPYRATIEKRDRGTVTFRLIAGNADSRADSERRVVQFNPSATYFWKFTWGHGLGRLVVIEGGENGRVVYDASSSYGGTYRPNPHIAHLGAPPGRAGLPTASVPGAVISQVWLSNRPRPSGLGQ